MTTEYNIKATEHPIIITNTIGKSIDEFILAKEYSSIYVLMDENIMNYCWPVLNMQSKEIHKAELLVIDPGENQKDIEIATQLWSRLSENQADRSTLFINFGGGMITDLGGFVASTFKRGISFINIPTSLLAMVDASLGGKTAINLHHHKNQIGLFSNAQAVFLDFVFLDTLDKRNLLNAYAEMIKHGIIASTSHWNDLINIKEITAQNLSPFIEKSIQIKSDIVKQDPLEKSLRKSLNFGHSIGHLLESWSLKNDKNPLLHGEAIAAGMLIEAYLSYQQVGLSKKSFEEIKKQITHHFPKVDITTSFLQNFKEILFQDKKKKGKKLNLTFVPEIGSYKIDQNCSVEDIRESLIYYKENC